MFYKAVVQLVLLYGSEMWFVTLTMLKALEGFHHWVAHQITGKVSGYLPWEDSRWACPPILEVLLEAGLFSMEEYLSRHQNRIVDYVATRPIFQLCEESVRRLDSGASRRQFWWDQGNL